MRPLFRAAGAAALALAIGAAPAFAAHAGSKPASNGVINVINAVLLP